MIDRVLCEERARRAARRIRTCYGVASAIWMAAMAAFGAYLLLREIF